MKQSDDIMDTLTYAFMASLTHTTMTAHIFYYKWPGIKEDLVHEEIEFVGATWQIVGIKAPTKAFIHYAGEWFQKTAVRNANQVKEHQVPKEIRLHMLILM